MSRYNPASGGADELFWGKHLPAEITPRAFAHVGRKFLRQKISVGIHEPFGLKLGTLGPDTPYAPRSCPVQKPIHFFSIAEVDGFQLQMSRCRHSVSFLNCTAFGDVRCTRALPFFSWPMRRLSTGSARRRGWQAAPTRHSYRARAC